jgi:geranylgeranyl diphosphate synthase type II
MILKKSCWYGFIHPCRIGALVARPAGLDLEQFNQFGYFVGAALQIQSEILDVLRLGQRPGRTGGPADAGRPTLMLTHLHQQVSPRERQRLSELLGRRADRRLPRELDWFHDLLTRHGSIDFATARARELAAAAQQALEHAFATAPQNDDTAFLTRAVLHLTAPLARVHSTPLHS